jgi:hypothetical protein
MRNIGIASGRETDVLRTEGASAISLTFRGTSDARSSVDRDARYPIALLSEPSGATLVLARSKC